MSNTAKSEFEKYLEAQGVQNAQGLKAQGSALQSNLENTKSMLEKNYGSKVSELTQQKQTAGEEAEIAYQKLLKYLPEYNASMGLYGSGASETALLDAAARHRTAKGQILANYNSGVNAAASERDQGIYTAEQNYNQDMMNLYAQADAQKQTEEAEAKAEYDSQLAKAEADITSGVFDSAKLTEYYNGISDEQMKQALKPIYDQVMSNTITGEMESYSGTESDFVTKYGQNLEQKDDSYKTMYQTKLESLQVAHAVRGSLTGDDNAGESVTTGDNVEISTEGGRYFVQLSAETKEKDIVSYGQHFEDGDVFAYGHGAYYKKGGRIFKLENRSASHAYDYNRLVNNLNYYTEGYTPLIEELQTQTYAPPKDNVKHRY